MPKSLEAKISDLIQSRDALIAEIDAQIAELQAKKAELLAGGAGVSPKPTKGGRGRTSDVDPAELTRLVKKGWTGKKLATHFGVSTGTIQNHKTRLGLTEPRKKAAKKKAKKKTKKRTKKTKR